MKEKMITTSIYIEEQLMKDIKILALLDNRTPNNFIVTTLKQKTSEINSCKSNKYNEN